MRRIKWLGVSLLVAGMCYVPTVKAADEGGQSWVVQNRIRVEYDDNIRQSPDGLEDSSLKIIEEVSLFFNMDLENTFISGGYRPVFTWWDDRPEDDSDLHHDLDLIISHEFSPRSTLSLKDTFRFAELPELIGDDAGESGRIIRKNNDFIYNSAVGNFAYKVSPATRASVAGRYILLRYDDDAVAANEDFDQVVFGLTLDQELSPDTTVGGELRFNDTSYDGIERGSESVSVGGRVDRIFSPNLIGTVRGGYESKDLDSTADSSADSPYIDASVTVLPSPATRLTLAGGFSQYESGVFPFANQERTRLSATISHDVTARITVSVTGSFTDSDYDAAEAASDAPAPAASGSEEIVQVSSKVSYKSGPDNSFELGWQFTDLDSDLREDFEQNRVSVGWKTTL